MTIPAPEFYGQPEIEPVQAPNPRLSFAAIVAAVANEKIGLVHRSLVGAEISERTGTTTAISHQAEIPLIGTDKEMKFTPVITDANRRSSIEDVLEAIDQVLMTQSSVALRHTLRPDGISSKGFWHWVLIAGRHDRFRYRAYGSSLTTRRVKRYEVIDPSTAASSIESPDLVRALIRNSFRPFYTLNAVGVDIVGPEHPDRVER